MKLGILTAPFADTPLEGVADWAVTAGFQALEIACWPAAGGEKRRYAGTAHLPVETMKKDIEEPCEIFMYDSSNPIINNVHNMDYKILRCVLSLTFQTINRMPM